MKQGLLIRVAIDSTYGEWNAPENPDNGDFVYLPITEPYKQNNLVNLLFAINLFLT